MPRYCEHCWNQAAQIAIVTRAVRVVVYYRLLDEYMAGHPHPRGEQPKSPPANTPSEVS